MYPFHCEKFDTTRSYIQNFTYKDSKGMNTKLSSHKKKTKQIIVQANRGGFSGRNGEYMTGLYHMLRKKMQKKPINDLIVAIEY